MADSKDFTRVPGELPEDPTASLKPPSRAMSSAAQAFLAEEKLREGTSENAFILRQTVGEGSFGEVWEALQITLNRVVAVKRPREEAAAGSTSERAQLTKLEFYKEALVTAKLDHPNIVPVYDLGRDETGRPLLAMKLVKGAVWSRLLEEDFWLPPEERLALHLPTLILVSQAVAFAHSRGIVHRDLKPSQVMVGRYGEVFLMDWGLAVSLRAPAEPTGDQTVSLATPVGEAPNPAGTVAYMAPEQTDSTPERISERTDVFLLGGILYYILTKTYPHPQQSSLEAFQHAAKGQVEPPQERTKEELPEEVVAICMRAMARNPGDRFASAVDFVNALQSYLSGTGRRDTSRKLTAEAVKSLASANGEYAQLEHADQLLAEARGEWADNPDAVAAHGQVLEAFAHAALAKRDLKLAEAQASRVENADTRARLLTDVHAAAALFQRQNAQRKFAIAASFVLTVLAVGFGVYTVHSSEQARHRQAQQDLVKEKIRNDAKLAEAKTEQERKQAALFERIGSVLADTSSLAELVEQQLPFPTSLQYERDWSPMFIRSKPDLIRSIVDRRADLENRRVALTREKADIPPYPYAVLQSDAVLALNQAGNTTNTIPAYYLFQAASKAEPDRIEALVGMAVSAGRAREYTSATDALRAARRMLAGRTGWPFDYVLHLQREIGQIESASFHPNADDVIIEAHAGGINNAMFKTVSGNWLTMEGGSTNKSAAQGLTTGTLTGSLRYFFYSPLARVYPGDNAVARFSPQLKRAGKYHVYATWCDQANATPVHYIVKHKGGEAVKSLVQDGLDFRGGNGSQWVLLGEFDFAADGNEFVEVRVGKDVRPLTPLRYGQAIIDGVYFAAQPLQQSITETPLDKTAREWKASDEQTTTPDLLWLTDYHDAKERARKSGKKLLSYVFNPISSYYPHPLVRCRDYCNNRIFTDEQVKQVIRSNYEIVSLNSGVQLDAMKELGLVDPTTTLLIGNATAPAETKISGDDLLLSPADFVELLRTKGTATPAAE